MPWGQPADVGATKIICKQDAVSADRPPDDVGHEALSDALSNLRVLRREARLPANHPNEKSPEPLVPDF